MKAIIFCAGIGKRFLPASSIRPKPLTPINNVPIVESTLQMLRTQGIQDIYLIIGDRAASYAYLQDKYGVKFIYNDEYDCKNTHSSLLKAKEHLHHSLLIDGDVIFLRNVFDNIHRDRSQFVVQATQHVPEWEVFTDADDRILSVKKWTTSGYSMAGLSYWTGKAADMLIEELQLCETDDYWEEAALRVIARTPVYAVREEPLFLREVDCLMDAEKYGLLTHEEIARLCSHKHHPVRMKSLTNSTWLIHDAQGRRQCLRVPGKGTSAYIDRAMEPLVLGLIEHLSVTPETRFYPGGLKCSAYMGAYRTATREDVAESLFSALAARLRKINAIPHSESAPLAPTRISDLLASFSSLVDERYSSRLSPGQQAWAYDKGALFDTEKQVLCHRDLALENILISKKDPEDILLIDFEYAGFTNQLWEYASFILETDLSPDERQSFTSACGIIDEDSLEKLLHMEILVDYIWSMWGHIQGYFQYSEYKIQRMQRKLIALNIL